MSQPRPAEHESDPLLAFFEETASPQPVAPVEPVEVSVKPPVPAAPDPVERDRELRQRIECAERQIERTLIDITAVKGDLATLVNAVDDIKRRMSRPPAKLAPVVALPSRKAPWRRAMAAVVILLMTAAAAWGLMPVAVDDLPEPPTIKRDASSAPEPLPVVESPPQVPVVVQTPTPRVVPARAAPASERAPRPENYVGTLTVDAEPAGDVYLNRKSVGRTPVRLENLRAGSHLIWIESEGYRRWTRVVAVTADRISRVSASLDPLSR